MRDGEITNAKAKVRVKKKTLVAKKKPAPPKRYTRDGRVKKKTGKKETREIQERRMNAMELRGSGVTYRDIAEQLGYHDASHARRDIEKGIADIQIDAAKGVVAMDLLLMDEFKMRCLHQLRTNHDLGQIDRIMRVMEFKYRLLGVTDETVRQLQGDFGIMGNVVNNTNNVMVVGAAPETEKEFISKMMGALGINPDSPEAKEFLRQHKQEEARTLPMLEGSANQTKKKADGAAELEDMDIVDAEIVE